ncbi:MAG: hypothetical protein M9945_18300 [Aquamicrobium sp.]|uniref:hypothetical protein n=1 Tax=Aquamicrobium sp. TaxID=1872579 RepID=UPI00349EBFDB|nr:hypothetical protein [Aquamicrobium sp.]
MIRSHGHGGDEHAEHPHEEEGRQGHGAPAPGMIAAGIRPVGIAPAGVAASGIALPTVSIALPAIMRSAAVLSGIAPSGKPASGNVAPESATLGIDLAAVDGTPLTSRTRHGPTVIAAARKPFDHAERFDQINLLDRTIWQIHNRRTNNDLAEAAP